MPSVILPDGTPVDVTNIDSFRLVNLGAAGVDIVLQEKSGTVYHLDNVPQDSWRGGGLVLNSYLQQQQV